MEVLGMEIVCCCAEKTLEVIKGQKMKKGKIKTNDKKAKKEKTKEDSSNQHP